MAIQIPSSPSLKRKVLVPHADHSRSAYDAESMNKLGADVPEAVSSRPTAPGGMRPAYEFHPGGHQPGQPGGRGGQGPVPTNTAIPAQRPYAGPPASGALAPAPPRAARPTGQRPSLAEYHAQLRQLHQRFNRYEERAAAQAPTLAEVNTARRHVAETRCRSCGVWLMGVRAGTAGEHQRAAAAQATQAKIEQSRRMAARQPEQRIAQLAREAGANGTGWHGIGPRMAQIDHERHVAGQAPKQQ